MNCINLKERFGDRYRVKYEESYYAERPEYRKEEAPWLMIIPCQHGHIGPWGGSTLLVCTRRRGPVTKRLTAQPFGRVVQDGDDGVTVLFDVAYFDQVARIMKPHKRPGRRHLPPQEKQRLVEVGRAFRFFTGKCGPGRALECVSGPGVV